MQRSNFKIAIHAKCLLAGEHAVLRNHPAIVAPVKSKVFLLKYNAEFNKNFIEYKNSESGYSLHEIFKKLLKFTSKKFHLDQQYFNGHFTIDNHIPIACGMGFSAALCLAMANWLALKKIIHKDNNSIFKTAKSLENLFHGKSSGVDVAGVAANFPIIFQHHKKLRIIKPKWHPNLYLSFSHVTHDTKTCVAKVAKLWQVNSRLANALDEAMEAAVIQMIYALELNENDGLKPLADSLNLAKDCFSKWGLINSNLEKHINLLLDNNALAVKPTGSGGGGYVISLWKNKPPMSLRKNMFPLSLDSREE